MSAFEWPQWQNYRGDDVDRWDEREITTVPTYLDKCPVCGALLSGEWSDREKHKAWHEGLGQ